MHRYACVALDGHGKDHAKTLYLYAHHPNPNYEWKTLQSDVRTQL